MPTEASPATATEVESPSLRLTLPSLRSPPNVRSGAASRDIDRSRRCTCPLLNWSASRKLTVLYMRRVGTLRRISLLSSASLPSARNPFPLQRSRPNLPRRRRRKKRRPRLHCELGSRAGEASMPSSACAGLRRRAGAAVMLRASRTTSPLSNQRVPFPLLSLPLPCSPTRPRRRRHHLVCAANVRLPARASTDKQDVFARGLELVLGRLRPLTLDKALSAGLAYHHECLYSVCVNTVDDDGSLRSFPSSMGLKLSGGAWRG